MTSAQILHHILDATYAGPWVVGGVEFVFTKHVLMMLLAAALLSVLLPLHARARAARGELVARGVVGNAVEGLVVLIRDGLVYPTLGEEEGRRFLPFFLTLFFFILTANLLGLVPGIPQAGFDGGTATGNFSINLALAATVLGAGVYGGVRKFGLLGYLGTFIPLGHDVHWAIRLVLGPLLFALEVVGALIRHGVLAVRLFANMIAGHMVILAILGMIFLFREMISSPVAHAIVSAGPLGLAVGVYGLELLVAFIQAGVFLYLSVIFVGAAVHPHH